MRPRQVRNRLALMAFGAILTGATLGTGIAKADTAVDYAAVNAVPICSTLDAFPNFAGIEGIATAIVGEGYMSFYDAGRAIGMSVAVVCPWHQPLIDRYAATYAPVQKRAI